MKINKNKMGKNGTLCLPQKMHLSLGFGIIFSSQCQTLGPVCSQGLARKAFLGANFLRPNISMRTSLCVGNLQLIYQQPEIPYSVKKAHVCSQRTESHKLTIFSIYRQVFNVKFYLSNRDPHLQKVDWSLVQKKVWVYSTLQHMSV